MKLYKVTLIPKSTFATHLKGDTFFGHLCWAVLFELGENRLNKLLNEYKKGNPFLIVSDGFAKNHLPKPSLPLRFLGETDKKEARKKRWMTFENLKNGNYLDAKTNKDIGYIEEVYEVVKNSLNYNTFTTDSENFAPYGVKEININERDVYILIDENQISRDEIVRVLETFENLGYGKDVSSGKGRFEFEKEEGKIVLDSVEIDFESFVYMSLSPFVLNENVEEAFYNIFVRFGKHGANRVHKNAFKKPVLMFDTASVIKLNENKTFIGKAITNISTYKDTVHQGYSILIPIRIKDKT